MKSGIGRASRSDIPVVAWPDGQNSRTYILAFTDQ